MKKIFTIFAMAFAFVFANAEEVTFNFTDPSTLVTNPQIQYSPDNTDPILLNEVNIINGPVSIRIDCPEGTQSSQIPRLFYSTAQTNGGWAFRFYKDSEVIIMMEENTYIESATFNATNLDKNGVTFSYNGTFENNVWTPNTSTEDNIVITKSATGNNPVISSLTIVYKTDTTSGLTTVTSEETVEYYNLQGVRIDNPDNGIFIKKTGNKVEKVVVRN